MKVGDYVRTDIGEIRKIMRVADDIYALDKDIVYSHKNKIKKSNPNIIDLIEEGDYVNGHLVIKRHNDLMLEDTFDLVQDEDIKSIVTKEQFEAMQYKVGE